MEIDERNLFCHRELPASLVLRQQIDGEPALGADVRERVRIVLEGDGGRLATENRGLPRPVGPGAQAQSPRLSGVLHGRSLRRRR